MKIKEINFNNSNSNNFSNSHNNNSPKKIQKNKNTPISPISTDIFKNSELKKSLSINIQNSNMTPKNLKYTQYNNFLESKKSFITTIPISNPTFHYENNLPDIPTNFLNNKNKTRIKSGFLKNRKTPKNFELQCFNDERCFSTTKPRKEFNFPRNYFIIKQYRLNHDTNIFNLRHVLTDYTKEYEKHPGKIKEIYHKDKFINKIKLDILRLKFNHRIKPFDDL